MHPFLPGVYAPCEVRAWTWLCILWWGLHLGHTHKHWSEWGLPSWQVYVYICDPRNACQQVMWLPPESDWTCRRTLPISRKKTLFPPGPGMPSLTNDAPYHLFVIPDLKHECLLRLSPGSNGVGRRRNHWRWRWRSREARGGVRVPTLWSLPRMGFDQQ